MSQKVHDIKDPERQRIKERLKSEYKRFVRDNNQPIDELAPEEQKYYSSFLYDIPPKMVRRASPTDNNYEKVLQKSFSYFRADFLDIVIYQVMKNVYGVADVPTAEIILKGKKTDSGKIPVYPHEWGYLLYGPGDTFFEILDGNRYPEPQFIIWCSMNKNYLKEIRPEIVNKVKEFFLLLMKLLKINSQEYSIDNRLPGGYHQSTYYVNLYQQNLSGAKELLELSKIEESSRENRWETLAYRGSFKEAHDLHMAKGVGYLSAMTSFIIAFEGFINTLYKLFIRPHFKHRDYERATVHSPLDLRVLQLPLYCKGFKNAMFEPNDPVFKSLKEMTKWRNDIFHANLTKDNERIVTWWDGFWFEYDPFLDRNIGKPGKIRRKWLHTYRQYIEPKQVEKLGKTVEELVKAIIEQMEEKEKSWVKTWIDKPEIFLIEYTGVQKPGDCST